MSDKSKSEKSKKPVHTLRDGAIELAIWRNDGDKGPFFSVTHRRSYKQGDEWKDSDSYSEDDLLRLAKMLYEADTWIVCQRRQQRAQKAA